MISAREEWNHLARTNAKLMVGVLNNIDYDDLTGMDKKCDSLVYIIF